jgi:hypothetical protein
MRPVEYTHQLSILNKRKRARLAAISLRRLTNAENREVKMRDSLFATDAKAPVGSSPSEAVEAAMPTTDNDAGLLTLEAQFDSLVTELRAIQTVDGEPVIRSDRQSTVRDCWHEGLDVETSYDIRTKQLEAILARLYPVEQAIMAAPARTITGLGVKARHAAYIMSECWNAPADRIDWDMRAVRLLIEDVCRVGQVPLPTRVKS